MSLDFLVEQLDSRPDGGADEAASVAAQVAGGIGFIGASTIIFRREIVKGLTIAVSIWAVATVGLAVVGAMLLLAGVKCVSLFKVHSAILA